MIRIYRTTILRVSAAIAVIATLVCPPEASASDSSPAYNFLNIPSSTRIYGLGGINITTVDESDVMSIDQNPALMGPEFGQRAAVGYMRYIGESDFASIRYVGRASDVGAWSAAVSYYSYGSMKETDAGGNILGDFSPKDALFSGAYSHNLTDRLRGGFNIKLAYSAYGDYSALALATDLGLNYYNPERDLSLSLVVANLGGQVKRFDQAYDRLPVDVRLGWAKSFGTFPVRFSVTAWNLTKWRLPYLDPGDGSSDAQERMKDSFGSNLFRHLIFGADIMPSDKLNIGIGYNYKTRTDMATYSRSFLSGLSLCAGLNVSHFNVGIALAQPHSGATTFMLNLGFDLAAYFY